MNGEFERDEHHYDDGEDEEEEILTHAEHKAQGNELYKSKGTLFCRLCGGHSRLLPACWAKERAARARPSDYVYDHICQLAK